MKSIMIIAASMEEFLAKGKVITSASLKNAYDMFGEEECANYLIENNLGFTAYLEDVVEMKISYFDGGEEETIGSLLSGYPMANVVDGNLELESAYGGQKENKIITRRATLTEY
jgi:hypothetical protein